jgi:peroxiredoxin
LVLVLTFSAEVFSQKNKPLAENFSATTMDGQTLELESLKGKVVVLVFWSTRCAICAAEIPKLNQLTPKYQGKEVVFLALTTENPAVVKNFLKIKPFNFNILPDSFEVFVKYAEHDRSGSLNMSFPAYFVINQKGEIEMKANGRDKVEAISSQINRLLQSDRQ